MIRFKIKALLAEQSFRRGSLITINEVAEATGIHRSTLSKMVNEKGHNAGTESIDRLCRFFSCQPGDLMEYLEDSPPP